MNYALSDCERYESNTQGDCGGRVEEGRLPGNGDVILCENCRNKLRLNWCDECGCGTGHSSDCSKNDKSTSSPAADPIGVELDTFKVTRTDVVGVEFIPIDDERVLFGFVSPLGERLGVQLSVDGHLQIGGWNANGEWVDLAPYASCVCPGCVEIGTHTVAFALDQYDDDK